MQSAIAQEMTLRALLALTIASNAIALDQNLLPKAKYADSGGRCMDGSMAGYYYGPPSSGTSSLWVMYMKGGGGCQTEADCAHTAKGNLGSSTEWPSTLEPNVVNKSQHNFANYPSILDPNPTQNPDFHDAHHVYIPYCTGDGHTGQVVKPTSEQWGFFFSGHLNFKAILDELQAKVPAAQQMGRILLSGSSAGGIGTMMNCDYLQTYLDQAAIGAKVSCAPLAGWFYPGMAEDKANPEEPPSSFPDWSKGAVSPPPSAAPPWLGYLPTECTKGKSKEEAGYCGSAHNVYPHVKAPMFVVENQYDSSQSEHLGMPGNQAHTALGEGYLAYLGRAMRNSTHQVVNHPLGKVGDGLFLASCWQHANFPKVKGFNYDNVLADWFYGRGKMPHVLVDDCTMQPPGLPCNPDCKNPFPSPSPSPPGPPTPGNCEAALKKACGDSMGKWTACKTCAGEHSLQLGLAGCTPKDIRLWCKSSVIV